VEKHVSKRVEEGKREIEIKAAPMVQKSATIKPADIQNVAHTKEFKQVEPKMEKLKAALQDKAKEEKLNNLFSENYLDLAYIDFFGFLSSECDVKVTP